jgi:uncharacterized protein
VALNRRSPASTAALLSLAFVCLLACAGWARAQRPRAFSESPLPSPEGYVNDYANVIEEATEGQLEATLGALAQQADSIEFAVVTVPTTGDEPIFDYSLSVARGWGIGSNEGEKNGLLLLVAVNDRKYQVQVSRHLEGDLPDGLAGEIARNTLRDPFRMGDYAGGIQRFVNTTIATLAEKRNFTFEGVDRSQAYQPPVRQTRQTRQRQQSGLSPGKCCCIAAIIVVVMLILGGSGRGRRGGGGWGGGGGWLNALLLANLFSSLAGSGRGSSSGWGSGGGGSSGWGGGGGFGGFGGGGDFGGGGAGGDW